MNRPAIAAQRGGPFGWSTLHDLARAEREGAAPGTEFRFPDPAESSPVRRAGRRARFASALAALMCAALLWEIGAAVYPAAKAGLGHWLVQRAWERTMASGTAARPWPWAGIYPVARLIVPTRNIELVLLAGERAASLAWGPVHVDDTALPGAIGESVVAGSAQSQLGFVRDLVRGDLLIVETALGDRKYFQVQSTRIADVRDLRWAQSARRPRLTLVTGYPFDAPVTSVSLRFVVVAEAA